MLKRWVFLITAIFAAGILAACNSSSSGGSSSRTTAEANLGDPTTIEGTFFTASGNGMSYRMDGLGWQIAGLAVSDAFASDRLGDFLIAAALPADATFSIVRLSTAEMVDIDAAVEVMSSGYVIDVDEALALVQAELADVEQLNSSRLALRIASDDENFAFRTPLAVGNADEPDSVDTSPLSELLTRELEDQALGEEGDVDAYYDEIDPLEVSAIRDAFINAVNELVAAIDLSDLDAAQAALTDAGVTDSVSQVIANASTQLAAEGARDALVGNYNQIFFQTSLIFSDTGSGIIEHLPAVTDLTLGSGDAASELSFRLEDAEQSVQAQFGGNGAIDESDFRFERLEGIDFVFGTGVLGSNNTLVLSEEGFIEQRDRDGFLEDEVFLPATRRFTVDAENQLLVGASRETSFTVCRESGGCNGVSNGSVNDRFTNAGMLIAAPVLGSPIDTGVISGQYGTVILTSILEEGGDREIIGSTFTTNFGGGGESAQNLEEIEYRRLNGGGLERRVLSEGFNLAVNVPDAEYLFPFGNGALELNFDDGDTILRGFAMDSEANLMAFASAPVCIDNDDDRVACAANDDDELEEGIRFANFNGDDLSHNLAISLRLPTQPPEIANTRYRLRGTGIVYGADQATIATAITGGTLAISENGMSIDLGTRVEDAIRSDDEARVTLENRARVSDGSLILDDDQAGRFELRAGTDDAPVTGDGFISADGRHLVMAADFGDQSGTDNGDDPTFGGIILIFGTLVD